MDGRSPPYVILSHSNKLKKVIQGMIGYYLAQVGSPMVRADETILRKILHPLLETYFPSFSQFHFGLSESWAK